MPNRRAVTSLFTALALIIGLAPGAFAAGTATASGTTVMDGDSVSTDATAAVVHLANRQAVRLEPYSEARFESSDNGVLLSVSTGKVSYQTAGTVRSIEANESALIEPAAPENMASGSGGDERIELCELVNKEKLAVCSATPKKKVCDWQLVVASSEEEAEALIAEGARYQGEDGLDCKSDKGPLIVGAGAGVIAALSAAQVAGIVAGGVLGAVVVNDVNDGGTTAPIVDLSPNQ